MAAIKQGRGVRSLVVSKTKLYSEERLFAKIRGKKDTVRSCGRRWETGCSALLSSPRACLFECEPDCGIEHATTLSYILCYPVEFPMGQVFSIGESSFSAPREESEAEGDREILRGWWMGWKKVESDRRLVLARRWTDPSARDFCKRRDELAPDDYFVGLRD
uniref:Uncharacterized protein n=1 Tax=Vespula pensylvanica TaxID=30213 RepID=A0A834N0M2_VESPE|nr:hypothetical protein H0235_017324 [Vespula pensylvanica]